MATPHASTPVKRIELMQAGDLRARILNTGNVETGLLTLTLTGDNAAVFTLSAITVSNLSVGGEADITLTPRAGLEKGVYKAILTAVSDGLTPVSLEITYTVTTTANEEIGQPQGSPLRAWTQNGTLYVSGLIVGELWSVYNFYGVLIYRNIATDSEAKITLPERGMYIVRSGDSVLKIIN